MLFNSLEFLVFVVPVYAGYRLLAHRAQNLLLLGASYLFYASWDWRFLSLILISTVVDHVCGRRIHASTQRQTKRRFLILSLTVNLGLLGVFKYFDFFATSLAELLGTLGLGVDPLLLDVVLPVGISFF